MKEKLYTRRSEDGDLYYYKDPEKQIQHRRDGPAVIYEDGDVEYWQNGRMHRLDGPARHYSNIKDWIINGIVITGIESGFYSGTETLQDLLDAVKNPHQI